MTYELGVDLGTTYTAAAVHRDGRVEIVTLGNRAASVPSVVLLKEDESILAGDAANRRAVTEPGRVAREFKRRVGDPTPLLLGGTPYSAEAVMARLLRWVVDQVSEREGGPPGGIALTRPANWGPYKRELFDQAMRLADLEHVTTLTEPEAAAIYYASQERIDVGSVIAVYDLGGGTFDAAVLRKTGDGWELLGEPEGIERLGGIDVDEAVYQHVRRSLVDEFSRLDPDDPAVMAAVARLRHECVEAKEALSTDTDASIPVLLPNVQTEVRLTRAELEAMIRPTLQDTVGAMQRALRSAGVGPDEVSAVLLVGGSSRIPLVAQLVSAEFGRPVAVDAHPKNAIALGAAMAAGRSAGGEPTVVAPPPVPPPIAPPPPLAPPPPAPAVTVPAAAPASGSGGRARALLAGAAAALVALVVVVFVVGSGDGDGDGEEISAGANSSTTEAESSSAPTTTAPTTTAAPARPDGPFVEVGAIRTQSGRFVFDFEAFDFEPSIPDAASSHVHFFWDTLVPENAGVNGPSPGQWLVWDGPRTVSDDFFTVAARPPGASAICAVVGTHEHAVADVDGDGEPDTDSGTCSPLPA